MRLVDGVMARPRLKKGLLAGLALVVLFALFGFFALPPLLKPYFMKLLSETVHRQVTIREIRVNPFELSVTVRGVDISERGSQATWISVGEIFGSVNLSSVVRGGLVVGEVHLYRPYVRIVRDRDGSYNFSDLINEFSKGSAAPAVKPEKETEPFRYSFNNIRILNGSIDFEDGPINTKHEVRGIDIAVPFISNMKYLADVYVQPSFSATVNGRLVATKGKTKLFHESLETSLEVNIANLDLSHYLGYAPFQRDYEVPSAFLDVALVVSFTQQKGKTPSLSASGAITLRDLKVNAKDKSPLLRLPSLKVDVAPSELLDMKVRLAAITVQDPAVNVSIDGEGVLNLLSLVPKTDAKD
ncbi:MAG: DUF748 domain-containing protein, partial [Myxococcota bacterium]